MYEKRLLSPENFLPSHQDWKINGIFNPAAVRLPNGKIALFVRVAETPRALKANQFPRIIDGQKYSAIIESIPSQDIIKKEGNMIFLKNGTFRLSDLSHFRKVIVATDGVQAESIERDALFHGHGTSEECGVEDPRITKIHNEYCMVYTSVSLSSGITVSLARSKNLSSWKHEEIIFSHENKDCVLFPEKINGKYVALHRPNGSFNLTKPSIWIAYSKELHFWGKSKPILAPRNNAWDSVRIGAGCPPIKTKKGWLCIYHGVHSREGKNVYSAGAFVLDLHNLEKVLARSPHTKPLFAPHALHETHGFVNNVVFPTGIVPDLDGKSVLIYSGTADKYISVRKILLDDIFKSLEWVK